ncbi:DUF1684 domain-containing protein [Dyadobacter frigoris]|uniref:DUF1684 domain-containing protein n=1 Tax=Dyadobacter frigoris TaxID=2576211 RepID=A0A4U6D8R3_9BACT|nr:DUF1684 domain-containing protein [Dyadobacter frigoris]TKT92741.1 DUF1684 domain-containing protein [Dyadobacter frigoris]GLU51640.1 hypothetical protein Dfri01_11010 [Dyadobacter frigoris]
MNNKVKFRIPKVLSILIIVSGLFSFISDTGYENEIKEWRKQRIKELKSEQGYLNLAGLFWLEEGRNTFGSDGINKFIFPSDRSPANLGEFILENGEVTLIAKPEAEIYANNQLVTKLIIFPSDEEIVLKYKTLRWFVIKRGEKYAIRLKDLDSPYLKYFKGIESFPITEQWKVKAKFEPTVGRKISIMDVTGRLSEQESPGVLVFNIKGKEYRLDALSEGESFFILFGDKTNKNETYGGGRFVYTNKPDADGYVSLDFNKAYNPPCAFTPYATCPLPPKQNMLALTVTAGEKNYGHH